MLARAFALIASATMVLFACAPAHPSELQSADGAPAAQVITIQNAKLPVCSTVQQDPAEADLAPAAQCRNPELHMQLLVTGNQDLTLADFEAQVTALGAKVVDHYEATVAHLHRLSVTTTADDGDDQALCQRFMAAFNRAPYTSLSCFYTLGSPITGSAGVHN